MAGRKPKNAPEEPQEAADSGGEQPVHLEHRRGDPRSLKLLEVNARYMRHETFQRLVANIRRDGVLTQWPLVYRHPDGTLEVLSGNHRVKAAIAAGLEAIDWTEVDQPLSADRRTALALSHNAIVGEDDLSILKQMYESISSVDERLFAGLDDATLDLLAEVDADSLAEANLDFLTLQVVFLPHELEAAQEAFEQARKLVSSQEKWLAQFDQYRPTLAAVETARGAYSVGNMATAIGIILEVFEAHLDDLTQGWFDAEAGVPRFDKPIPVEVVVGERAIPSDAAAIIRQAMDKVRRDADLGEEDAPWRALEYLAADYLAGE